jgi:tellurite resistance protein TerA
LRDRRLLIAECGALRNPFLGTPPALPAAFRTILDRSGRVRSDTDFVFYNQPAAADGSVRHAETATQGQTASDGVDLILTRVAPDVDRILIAVCLERGSFADLQDFHPLVTPLGGVAAHTFRPNASIETALLCAEIYRRNNSWRLRALGQGYRDGLAGLARDFGVNVA